MITSSGIGRFVKDPVIKDVGSSRVCEFALAVDERRKGKDGKSEKIAHFFNFAVWDKAADVISEHCKKGDAIYFVATPRQEKWKDKTDGSNREKVVFRITEFSFVSSKKNASGPTQADAESSQDADIPF